MTKLSEICLADEHVFVGMRITGYVCWMIHLLVVSRWTGNWKVGCIGALCFLQTTVSCLSDSLALWLSGSLALWLSGSLALLHSGNQASTPFVLPRSSHVRKDGRSTPAPAGKREAGRGRPAGSQPSRQTRLRGEITCRLGRVHRYPHISSQSPSSSSQPPIQSYMYLTSGLGTSGLATRKTSWAK
jgi:hypothetical protein